MDWIIPLIIVYTIIGYFIAIIRAMSANPPSPVDSAKMVLFWPVIIILEMVKGK